MRKMAKKLSMILSRKEVKKLSSVDGWIGEEVQGLRRLKKFDECSYQNCYKQKIWVSRKKVL